MQVGSIATIYPFRTTTAAAPGVMASDTQNVAERVIGLLKSIVEEDTDSIKARAKQRLEDAKAQLEYLRRWRFNPEVLARQAGQLAREVGAAANDFAAAVNAGSTTGIVASGSTSTQVMLVGQSDAQTAETADSDEGDKSFAQKAYRDIMEDGADKKTVSADDRKTVEEFKAVAQKIKALLEEALRRAREQKNADQNAITGAQESGESLNQAIQGMNEALDSSSPTGAQGVTIEISVNITI